MLMTESYNYLPKEEIKVGEEYYFGQLWDEEGDEEELLKSGCIGIYDDSKPSFFGCDNWVIVRFDIIEKNDNVLDTVVKITEIDY